MPELIPGGSTQSFFDLQTLSGSWLALNHHFDDARGHGSVSVNMQSADLTLELDGLA